MLTTPAGIPDLGHQLGDPERAQRRQLGRLEDHGVAGGERRAHLPAAEHEREVPRHDLADDAERLAEHVVQETRLDRDHVALDLVGHAAEVAERRRGPHDVEVAAVADRVARVERLDASRARRPRASIASASLQQQPAAGRRPAARPRRERRRGRLDGPVDVGRARPRATSASTEPSCGFERRRTSPRRAASTNSPPMNRRSWRRSPLRRSAIATVAAPPRRQIWTAVDGSWPLEMRAGSSGSAFSQTSSIDRFGA